MRSMIRPLAAAAAAVALLAFSPLPTASAAPGDRAQRHGQGQEGPLVRLLDIVNEALAKVNLDEQQTTSTHQILEDARAQLTGLRDEARGAKGDKDARQQLREKAQKIIKETRDKLEAVLTADQKPVFRQALKDAREKARQDRQGDGNTAATQPAN